MIELRGWVEGPRWAGLADFIEQTAIGCRLDIVSIRERKSLLGTTIYYTMRGSKAGVRAFKRIRERAFEEYNFDRGMSSP